MAENAGIIPQVSKPEVIGARTANYKDRLLYYACVLRSCLERGYLESNELKMSNYEVFVVHRNLKIEVEKCSEVCQLRFYSPLRCINVVIQTIL